MYISGQQLLYEKTAELNVSRITLDPDRGIYHSDFNLDKRDRLLAEHGDAVEQEIWMERESWFVLRARRPGVSARRLARAYGLEELRDYLARSRREIDAMRGFAVAAGPPQARVEAAANGVAVGDGRGAATPAATGPRSIPAPRLPGAARVLRACHDSGRSRCPGARNVALISPRRA